MAAESGPRCEVVAVAKKDLEAGDVLDGVGGYCVYGLIDNAAAARRERALPIGLSEGCTVRRAVERDAVLTAEDVEMPAERLGDRLWREQQLMWPVEEEGALS